MHRWGFLVLITVCLGMGTSAAHAQNTNPSCQQLIFSTVSPMLQAANRFNPNGMFPAGFAPLAQPFGSSPNEPAYTAYPAAAYYSSYVVPAWAQANPQFYPAGYPGQSMLPGLYPPDVTAQIGADPNPLLTSAGILRRLQSDGTLDSLSPTEQADWLLRLANLQREEINQRFAQANRMQAKENVTGRAPRATVPSKAKATGPAAPFGSRMGCGGRRAGPPKPPNTRPLP